MTSIYRIFSLALVALCACGSARLVQMTDQGGELVLRGNQQKARKDAEKRMKKHCRGPYEIVEDGAIVVQASGQPSADDGSIQSTGSPARTEWRITFRCGQGQTDESGELIEPAP